MLAGVGLPLVRPPPCKTAELCGRFSAEEAVTHALELDLPNVPSTSICRGSRFFELRLELACS